MAQKRMTAAEFRQYAFQRQTEEEFVDWILRLAELRRWHRVHFRPALTQSGNWVTPIQGDTGFPDLVLAKPGRPVHIWEAKSEDGKVRPDQRGWLAAMSGRAWSASDAGIVWPMGRGFSVGVVRPSMRDEIEKELG